MAVRHRAMHVPHLAPYVVVAVACLLQRQPAWALRTSFPVLPGCHVGPENETLHMSDPWAMVDPPTYVRAPENFHYLKLSNEDVAAKLREIYYHPTTFPSDRLRAGRGVVGDTARVRLALNKLLKGQPVKVAVVGGSVSAGDGTAFADKEAYAYRVFRWINETFPAAQVQFFNPSVGGITSFWFANCWFDMIPEDVDLVFYEVTLNDFFLARSDLTTPLRQAFEISVRKTLNGTNSPAMVILHWYAVFHSHARFYDTDEDVLDIIAQYYKVPSLSFRNAAHDLIVQNVSGFTYEEVYCDTAHPTPLGHRYFADLVIGYLQDLAADVLLNPITAVDTQSIAQPLIEPMMVGNDHTPSTCVRGDEFKSVRVVQGDGFEWGSIYHNGKKDQGYVATKTGAKIRFQIDSNVCRGKIFNQFINKVSFGLGYVRNGLRPAGTAVVSCEADCGCEVMTLDASYDRPVVEEFWQYSGVDIVQNCQIQVEVTSLPPNAKFELSSLQLSCTEPSLARAFRRANMQLVHGHEHTADVHCAFNIFPNGGPLGDYTCPVVESNG